MLAKLTQHRVGQQLARPVPARGTQVVFVDHDARNHSLQDLEPLAHHLGTDAIAWDDRELHACTSLSRFRGTGRSGHLCPGRGPSRATFGNSGW